MHEGRCAVLTGLHEAQPRLAVRQRQFFRSPRIRWLSGLCRSGGGRRLRLRDESNGYPHNRRPSGFGAQRRSLLRYSGLITAALLRSRGLKSEIKLLESDGRHSRTKRFGSSFPREEWREAMTIVESGARVTLKNILYLTDFSEPSEAALPFVTTIAREYQSKVYSLY